jgi:hypothetical protein
MPFAVTEEKGAVVVKSEQSSAMMGAPKEEGSGKVVTASQQSTKNTASAVPSTIAKTPEIASAAAR